MRQCFFSIFVFVGRLGAGFQVKPFLQGFYRCIDAICRNGTVRSRVIIFAVELVDAQLVEIERAVRFRLYGPEQQFILRFGNWEQVFYKKLIQPFRA